MKHVAALRSEPDGLAAYREANVAASWDEFRTEAPGAAKALSEALAHRQGWLCAYCELDIHSALHRQVEHVDPKSTSARHLDPSNLIACCEGGANPNLQDRERFAPPIKTNLRCGQRKGDRCPQGAMLDPRDLPRLHAVWDVDGRGVISPDPDRCVAANIDPDLAARTIDVLGLNTAPLTKLRARLVQWLNSAATSELTAEAMRAVAEPRLLPTNGRFERLWSTTRAWAGPTVDAFIAAHESAIFELEGP